MDGVGDAQEPWVAQLSISLFAVISFYMWECFFGVFVDEQTVL